MHVLDIVDEELDLTGAYEHRLEEYVAVHKLRHFSNSVLLAVADEDALQDLRGHATDISGVHLGQLVNAVRELLWVLRLRA